MLRPTVQRGIQCRVRILEDHGHRGAQPAQLSGRSAAKIPAVEPDITAVRLDHAQRESAQRRLTGPRFTDNAKGLARREVEAHIGHGADHAARAPANGTPVGKRPGELADGQQRGEGFSGPFMRRFLSGSAGPNARIAQFGSHRRRATAAATRRNPGPAHRGSAARTGSRGEAPGARRLARDADHLAGHADARQA